MGFRFRKSINLGSGFRINLSKSGIGHSWGIKGFRTTRTATGRKRNTFSIPGTGISYVNETSKHKLIENSKSTETNDKSRRTKMKKKKKFVPIMIGLLILGGAGSLGNHPEEPIEQPTEIHNAALDGNEISINESDDNGKNNIQSFSTVPESLPPTTAEEKPAEEEPAANVPTSQVLPTIVAPIINNTEEASSTQTSESTTESAQTPVEYEAPIVEKPTAEQTVVYITNTGKKYHRSNCRHLDESKYETTLENAISQGYTACKTCDPPTQ